MFDVRLLITVKIADSYNYFSSPISCQNLIFAIFHIFLYCCSLRG